MDTGRLLLCAGLILAPPLAWVVGVIVYNVRRRARRNANRPTVAEVIERSTSTNTVRGHRESAGQPSPEAPPSRLPRGWHWPDRDPDA